MLLLQVTQFRREHPTRIWLLGAENLPREPLLIEGETFAEVVSPRDESKLIELTLAPPPKTPLSKSEARVRAEDAIANQEYDAVIFIPDNFAEELRKFGEQQSFHKPPAGNHVSEVPQPEVFANTSRDKSRVANERVDRILSRWRGAVIVKNLEARNVPVEATRPFEVVNNDVAAEGSRQIALWSKILPFILLVWALTGAFYPAIDLCAGEKERGTLETLLSSPAQRSEIVWGKLLTVMSFSVATSLLNLLSMAGTGSFVMTQMQRMDVGGSMPLDFGPPPLLPMLWLLVALIPIAALFSALSLAVAAFARSSKEGQYYLMPLLLFSLPLMLFPLMPATELDLGTAIIPVTGVMLLLRTLMEGQYWDAARYALPVAVVTAFCCLLAVRWAIDQFNNESVLFRESERWDIGLWLKHLVRDRGETPTIGEAILCGVLILMARFFAGFAAPATTDFRSFAIVTLVLQIALIATPALLMAVMLTSNPRKTLSLFMPRWQMLPMAVLLAVLLHPVAMWLSVGIHTLYPLSEDAKAQIQALTAPIAEQPLVYVLLLLAVTPAICEELAFRGFILSGLRHTGHRWMAIAGSAVFFGITHSLLQQSLSAIVLGMVIGYITLRTGSLIPGVLFHVTHNSLAITAAGIWPDALKMEPAWEYFVAIDESGLYYNPYFTLICGALAACILYWLQRQPYAAFEEERIQQAIDHQTSLPGQRPVWRLW
jgi:sodium transport system permease protein